MANIAANFASDVRKASSAARRSVMSVQIAIE